MLHILLLILKIIGIILAVILGILVLLICIVVFAPVRYEVKAGCTGNPDDIKVKARAAWLFRFVRADVSYKEKRLKWRVCIAWKKFLGGADYGGKDSEKSGMDGDGAADMDEIMISVKEDDKDEEQDDEVKKAAENEEDEEGGSETEEKSGEIEEGREETEESLEKETEPEKETEHEKESGFHEEAGDKGDHENQGLYEKIKGAYCKIKCTIREICDKIKELLEKKNRILEFVQDETHRGAFSKLKKETGRLIRRLKPKRLEGKVVFGFEDPSVTGRALAAIAPFYPFYLEGILLQPDFERKILKGKLYAKGRVRFLYFLHLAWNLFWNRNVRRTYKDIRNFEI